MGRTEGGVEDEGSLKDSGLCGADGKAVSKGTRGHGRGKRRWNRGRKDTKEIL